MRAARRSKWTMRVKNGIYFCLCVKTSHCVLSQAHFKAYREIFSRSREFTGSFEAEIAFRKDRWNGLCSEVAEVIKRKDGNTAGWNRGVEEAYNRFKLEGLFGGET